jgi:hypothetical protein
MVVSDFNACSGTEGMDLRKKVAQHCLQSRRERVE